MYKNSNTETWSFDYMNKNIVFMTYMIDAPDTLDYAEWCFKSWKLWCKKNDVELFVLEDELQPKGDGTYNFPGMKPTWQRWHVFDVLENNDVDYDQVALVDVDTMIHPNAPSFFEETNREFSGVNDDIMVEWVYNSIKGYQDMFPNVKFDCPKSEKLERRTVSLPMNEKLSFCELEYIIDKVKKNV